MRRTMGVRGPLVLTLLLLAACVSLLPTSLEQEEDIPHNDVKNWALKFGVGLWEFSRTFTKVEIIRERYSENDVEVARKDGLLLIREMANEVKNMMDIKMNAVMRIMDSAEQVALSHKFDPGLKHRYVDARRFGGDSNPGDSDPLFDGTDPSGPNTTISAVLLPPGIRESDPEVMNSIKWSEQLDPLFVSNYEMDPSLSWQYLGSTSGFLRRYPASHWPGGDSNVEFRMAAWYAGAAASPKDVLVLLDSSGSMTGARREAAKAVVSAILDMLGDNDFVNVYRFSDTTEEIVPCFKDMLVQATMENIRELKNALDATKAENIANFSSALITAFELLHRYNRTGLGCQCNQAIALVTDGPPDTFTDIFKRFNEPHRPVRMFTFLVGGESAGAKEMRSIACSNKGFYARVGSRKEAESAVLNMLYVMARPMVMYQNDHPVQWTPVYAGTRGTSTPGRSKGSAQLMTSVSAPIFDRRNYTADEVRVANLLGVVGTDVPVEHIQKLVQPYKLGVNGYSFIVDNNGHVLFHPDLRPLTKTARGQEALKPEYNSVDLTEVELVDGEWGPRENNSLLLDLRRDMIDQKEGETELSVKIHYDKMKRVTTRRHKYFYNPIDGTPFSLGLAIPEDYGMYEVVGEREIKLQHINVTEHFQGTKWKVHPDWVYCEYNYAAENRFKTAEEQVLHFLSRTRKPGWKWMSLRPRSQLKDAAHMKKMEKDSYFCDKTLVQSLVYDAFITEVLETSEQKMPPSKDGHNKGNNKEGSHTQHELFGVTLSFVATRSGLLRWVDYLPPGASNDVSDLSQHFSENNQRTIDEVWYKRAVDQYTLDPESFVFSVPFDAGANPNTRVTATHALFVEHKGHKAPAAVVGLQFLHSTFSTHFINITTTCSSGKECKKTCSAEELDCYILDDNGFIIVSESLENTGRFFGQIDGTIMDSLVQDRIYKKVPVFDYQGACSDHKNPYSDSANRLSPLEPIRWFVHWFIGKIVWVAVQTSFYNLWNPSWARANDDGNLYGDYENSFDNYANREDTSLFPPGGGVHTEPQPPPPPVYPYTFRPPAHAPYTNEESDDFQPRHCDKRVDLYILQPDRLNTSGNFNPLKGKLTNCHQTGCERPFSVQKIPQSNLILLVVDTLCPCGSKQLSIMPQEVSYDASTASPSSGGCRNRPQESMYRRRPPKCMNYHPEETEIKYCGGCSCSSISPWICIICLVLWTISKTLLS